MPKVELIKTDQPRTPSFRLVWENEGKYTWQERVSAYLIWYKRFLCRVYGDHFYFENEDVALSGNLEKGKLYGVIHSWFIFQDEDFETRSKEAWDDFILSEQDNDPESAVRLICPVQKTWIWRHHPGQVILPDGEKIVPLDGYSYTSRRYYAGIYDFDSTDYFYLHNWKVSYPAYLKEQKTTFLNLEDLRNTLPVK